MTIYIEIRIVMNKSISFLIKEIRKTLINENKIKNIITTKIGLPTEISDWIIEAYPEKFQLWLANTFKEEAIKRIAGGKDVVANIMSKMLKGDNTPTSLKNQLNRQTSYFQGAFQQVVGYLQNRREIAPETDEINLKTLSLTEAIRRADLWQEAVQRLRASIITDENGKILKTYPDGFYWIDLQKSNCRQEAGAMGHCGNAQGNLFSLRKSKQSYLTGDVSKGSLIQLRGRANTKPKAEYHDKIMDFLLDSKVGIRTTNPSSYRSEQNFELKDLNLEQLNQLYIQKPSLFTNEELYKVLMKYPIFANQVNFRTTPLHQDHKEHFLRLHPDKQNLFI